METIYFTGYSGVGKSIIGNLLASRKNLKFIDIDSVCEKIEKNTISNIFIEKGEEYFRKLESRVLYSNIRQGMIIALGGGIVKDINNRHFIKKTGKVIYLKAKSSTIYKNLLNEYEKRPLLKNNFSTIAIDKILEEREPYYQELANYVINIDNKKIEEVLSEVLAIYHTINKINCRIVIK